MLFMALMLVRGRQLALVQVMGDGVYPISANKKQNKQKQTATKITFPFARFVDVANMSRSASCSVYVYVCSKRLIEPKTVTRHLPATQTVVFVRELRCVVCRFTINSNAVVKDSN